LRPEEIVAFDLADPRRMRDWQSFCEHYHGPVHAGRDAGNIYHCGGGLNAFAIDPQGRMSICILSQVDPWDLRQGSFRDGWEGFLGAVREREATRQTKCRECAIKNLCGMCPANGELEAGDPETPVDFLCHVAHLRAHAFGLVVPAHGACEYCAGGERHDELLRSAAALGQVRAAIGRLAGSTPGPALPVLGAGQEPRTAGRSGGGAAGGDAEAAGPVVAGPGRDA
jgi:radical SAM protein with 4Fe4S-binding SPASM domain